MTELDFVYIFNFTLVNRNNSIYLSLDYKVGIGIQ